MRRATIKQIKFATAISERTGIPLPETEDLTLYSMYIANFQNAPSAPKVMLNNGEGEAYIKIILRKMPSHCGECPLYEENVYVDDEPLWGDGIIHSCPFGASHWGCLVERPLDCPLKENKNEQQ